MTQIDCVLIGNNQMVFRDYFASIAAMGRTSGAYRDARLSFFEDGAEIVTCRDYVNRYQPGDPLDVSYDDIQSATVAYLGTYLHRRGYTADHVNSFQEGKADLARMLRSGRVATVAITTTYYVSPVPLLEVVAFVRAIDPSVTIIVGGPFIKTQQEIHSAASFHYLLRQIGADVYVVSDQGEQALVEVLEALRECRGYAGIANLVYRDGDAYVSTRLVGEDNPLDRNLVDWSLFGGASAARTRRMVMVRTARSCPFSCAFCSFPRHAGDYRYLDPADIWRELDQIEAMGRVNSVTFIDDTFNVPPSRFQKILEGLRDRQYSFKWNCNFRCQYATPDTVALMQEAGCEGVFLGLESASNRILQNMNKRAKAEQYLTGVEVLRDAGIMTYASFIIGFPGETDETVQETFDFIERAAPDFFRAQLWYYDTMTPIHKDAAKYGLRNSQFEWSHRTMNAKQAADWVDYLHGAIRGSIWLPQNDFDFPSLFCLLSRGWSLDNIKDIIRAFNRRVRLGLDAPDRAAHFDPNLHLDAEFSFDDPVAR